MRPWLRGSEILSSEDTKEDHGVFSRWRAFVGRDCCVYGRVFGGKAFCVSMSPRGRGWARRMVLSLFFFAVVWWWAPATVCVSFGLGRKFCFAATADGVILWVSLGQSHIIQGAKGALFTSCERWGEGGIHAKGDNSTFSLGCSGSRCPKASAKTRLALPPPKN